MRYIGAKCNRIVSYGGQLLDSISLTKKKTTKNNEQIRIKRCGRTKSKSGMNFFLFGLMNMMCVTVLLSYACTLYSDMNARVMHISFLILSFSLRFVCTLFLNSCTLIHFNFSIFLFGFLCV